MALIQVNQKLLHIIIALLIYGVCMESVKCPDVCHCVETPVYFGANLTSRTPGAGDNGTDSLRPTTAEPGTGDASPPRRADKSNKAADTNSTNDIFVRQFSNASPPAQPATSTTPIPTTNTTVPATPAPSSLPPFRNSKENATMKRTYRSVVNETLSSDPTTENSRKVNDSDAVTPASEDNTEGHKEGFLLTYQITCNQLGDSKALPLDDLPNPTTQLVIRRATFPSLTAFYAMLRDSSTRLSLLTDLSITDSVLLDPTDPALNQVRGDTRRTRIREFLPFASLQNPQQRSRSRGDNASASDLLLILNLSNNSLASLPRDLFEPYPNLQTLDLSNNRVEHLDDGLFAPLSNLLRLDLHGNRIAALAESLFENLGKLLTLDMSRNSVSDIAPSTFQYLTSLNTLILSDNPLSAKRQSMILLGTGKRLQIVDASKTGLKQIPGTLERSVRTLNLKGNYLSSIQCGDLDSYSLLTSLDLSENKISYVEDDALGRLELLATFDVHDNNLFQIPKSLPNNLQILNLSHNNIQNVTNSDFLNLSLLKELYIGYNQVNNVEDNSFDNLGDLRVLDLSHNPILFLPDMYGLFSLVSLDLSYFTNVPERFAAKSDRFPVRAPENIRFLNLDSSPLLARTFLGDAKTLASFLNLRELRLRFSNLTALGEEALGLLPNLEILRVEGNPWHCDRSILRLSRWLRSHRPVPEAEAARCATPEGLRRIPVLDLDLGNFPGRSSNLIPRDEVDSLGIEPSSNASRGEIDLGDASSTPSDSHGAQELPGVGNETKDTDESSFAPALGDRAANRSEDAPLEPTRLSGPGTRLHPEPTPSQTTESGSGRGATVAEAMRARGSAASADASGDAAPRLVLITFVGAVALATTAATILHVARLRKERSGSYERQSHDIEVHSISGGSGNELW